MEYLQDPYEKRITETLEKMFGPNDNMVKAAVKLACCRTPAEEKEYTLNQMRHINAMEAMDVSEFKYTLGADGSVVPVSGVTIEELVDEVAPQVQQLDIKEGHDLATAVSVLRDA